MMKIVYLPKQYRVRCDVTVSDRDNPFDLIRLLRRTRKKLRYEYESGRIAQFQLYQTRAETIHAALKRAPEVQQLSFVVGAGIPYLRGMHFEPEFTDSDDYAGYLTIVANAETVAAWDWRAVALAIDSTLRAEGLDPRFDVTEIARIIKLASDGMEVLHMPITRAVAAGATQSVGQDIELIHDTLHGAQKIIVHNLAGKSPEVTYQLIREAAASFTTGIDTSRVAVECNVRQAIKSLRAAFNGPEQLGIGLPVVLLTAFANKHTKLQENADALPIAFAAHSQENLRAESADTLFSPLKNLSVTDKDLHPPIRFKIEPDHMSASIRWIKPEILAGKESLTVEDIINSANQIGIVHGLTTELLDLVRHDINQPQKLIKRTIAKGSLEFMGNDPQLRLGKPQQDNIVNIREDGRKLFVRQGEVAAHFVYSAPPTPAKTIFGVEMKMTNQPFKHDLVGEGCKIEGNALIATVDGTPELVEGKVRIVSGYVHQGDVNAASGNIRMSGKVEVHGSIDAGATVEVDGSLLVTGSVAGQIRASGNVEVQGGFIGARQYFSSIGGDLSTSFIDNSRLIVHGNVLVQKSLTSSEVYCDGNLTVSDKAGQIVGGMTYVENSLQSANIGTKSGTVTQIFLGCNSRSEFSLKIRTERIRNMLRALDDTQMKITQLRSRAIIAISPKRKAELAELSNKAIRIGEIIKSLQSITRTISEKITLNKNAKANVTETLFHQAKFMLAGKKQIIREAIAGVCVSLKGHSIKIDALVEDKQDGEAKSA